MPQKNPKVAIIGASGYAGAELANLVQRHPYLDLYGLYVSATSKDAHKKFSELYPMYSSLVDQEIIPLDDDQNAINDIKHNADLVCLCTAHEVSMKIAPEFIIDDSKRVFDLSGAYRVNDPEFYEKYYNFKHTNLDWLASAVYGLAEWNEEQIKNAKLIAVPGCYPTASLTALKPLFNAGLIDPDTTPIINAVSGVSGSGRKASLTSSFCEVSLNMYGVFGHRHRPEISHHLGQKVLFQPHLGNFKRGILATIYVKLKGNVTDEQIDKAYHDAYDSKPLVRLQPNWSSIRAVEFTPFVDLHWQREGDMLIVSSAIDNLLKGASAQAMQCININCGYPITTSLI